MGNITLKNGKALPANPNLKKKHYWWKYLLFFFGGFITCVGVIVGGVAITGTVIKTRDLATMLGQNPDEILGIEYQNDTILSMVMKLTQQKFETLGDIDRVTPMVSKTINETLNPILSENLHYEFDWNELKTKPFTLDASSTRPESEYDHTEAIGDYIPRALKNGITLASFIAGNGESELSTILKYFLYPQNPDGSFDTENPYSIETLVSSGPDFFNDIVNRIKIGDIIDTTGNPFLNQIADWGVNDFTDEKIRTLEIAPLFDQTTIDNNPLLKAISDHNWTIADLSDMDNINSLTIGELIDTSGMTSGIVYAIKDKTISQLQEDGFVNTIKLADIFGESEGILGTLISKDYTVGDLGDDTKIKSLTLDEVLGGITSDSVLYQFKDTALKDVNDIDVSTVKLTSVLDLDTQIKTNNILNAIWEDNNDVTVGDLSDPDLINGLKLIDVFPDATGVLKTLADKNYTIGDLSDGSVVDNLTLDEVVGPIANDNILYNFKDTKLSEVDTIDVATVKLTQVLDLETEIKTNKVLNALWENNNDITVGDLKDESVITGLLIKDVFPSATGVLGVLADKNFTINDLSDGDTIDSLTLDEVLGGIDSSSALYQFRNTPLGEVDTIDFKTTKLTSVLDLETEIKTNKILNALWENNHDITVGDISDPDTIYSLAIDDVIDCTGNKVLESLAAKGATIDTLGEKIEDLTLTDVIDVGSDPDAIIYKIAHSTALSGKKIGELGGAFENLVIGDIITVTSTSPQVLKTLQNVALKDLGSTMESLTIKDVMELESTDPLYVIADCNINDASGIMTALKSGLKLSDVVAIDSSSPEVLRSLANSTLDEIPTVLTTLKLSEVITIDLTDPATPQILKSLADVTVFGTGTNNLNYKLSHLKFKDYFTEADCSSGILKVLWESTTPGGDFEMSEVASKINDLKLVDILGDKIYEDEDPTKPITGTWWYLLTEIGETFTSAEKRHTLKNGASYTVDDMDKLVKNMEDHMTNDCIRDLCDAGFITISDTSKLEEPITIKYMSMNIQPFGTKLLGDYKLNEIFDLFMQAA